MRPKNLGGALLAAPAVVVGSADALGSFYPSLTHGITSVLFAQHGLNTASLLWTHPLQASSPSSWWASPVSSCTAGVKAGNFHPRHNLLQADCWAPKGSTAPELRISPQADLIVIIYFFLPTSLYTDTKGFKNISCGQDRGMLLTAARLPVCPSTGITLGLHFPAGQRAAAAGITRRAASGSAPGEALGWDGMGWQPSSPHLHALPRFSRAVTRAGEQREQTRTVQGNQYLSRNTQASCQLSSNPI